MYRVNYYTVDKKATGILANAKCYEDVWYTEEPLSALEDKLCTILNNRSDGKYKPVITKIKKISGHF